MPEEKKIKVTETQNKYLLQLKTGSMTTNDLMLALMVSMGAAGRMIKKLKNAGLIESTRKYGGRGNILNHRLVKPYQKMLEEGLIITANQAKATQIGDSEILYAAILRNAGLTGQRLSGQYKTVFPKRGAGAIKNIVGKARKQGLCR